MTGINLKKFEKNLVVRPLRRADFEGIVALQQLCFPGMEPWSKEQFESQLNIFPEGQIGIEYQGKLVASSGSLILDFELYKDWHSFDEISDNGFIRNHRPECTPNVETVVFEDLDLELLKRHRQSGSVLNWQDRRTDIYEVRYLQNL